MFLFCLNELRLSGSSGPRKPVGITGSLASRPARSLAGASRIVRASLPIMTVFVALIRAINVGGTSMLSMTELRALCERCGFAKVTTYIQSGNVVLTSKLDEAKTRQKLEKALATRMGKAVAVHLRTPVELESIIERNPFKHAPANRLLVFFLDHRPPKKAFADLEIPGREQLAASGREVFIHFPDGMGRSKLKIPFATTATGRNLNTVRKLLGLSRRPET
jgi:uncharacterized protein (DUF1697 family)